MKIFSQIILLFILMCLYGHSFAQCNLSVSGTRTNVTCNGAADGSIQITISGEQGDITYLWNDGATTQNRSGLVPGIYTVTVTDDFVSNCNKKRTFQITEPDALEVNAIINNATTPGGNDGSINITVSGGTTPYSFLWSNSATTQNISSLSAGDYTVTVTDENDCVFTETYAVSDASCQIQVFPASPSICAGSGNGVQLIVTAFGATAYEWSPSTGLSATSGAAVVATPLVTQTYTVTASNLSDCAAIITVTVHPIPTVDLIPDAVYCNGAAATGINFTGTPAGAVFHWSSDKNIGFGTSGLSNINSYVATNSGNETDTATVTVYATANDCEGAASVFKILVHPTPMLDSIADLTFCNEENSVGIPFSSNVTGSTFSWTTKDAVNIGFGTAGDGNIPPFVALNAGAVTKTAVVKVVVTAKGCKSAKPPSDFSVNVLPTPVMNPVSDKTYCNGESIPGISFSSDPSGDTYSWTSSSNIGFGVAGTGNIPGFVVLNSGTSTMTSTITVFAVKDGCNGPVASFTISVIPTAVFTSSKFESACNGSPFVYTGTANISATFSWTRPLVSGISNAAGSGTNNIINETLQNITNESVVVFYYFQLNSGGNCISYDTLQLTVFPTAGLNSSLTESVCDDAPFVYLATSETPGTIFSWSRAVVPGISNPAGSDTINLINETLDNTTPDDIDVIYSFTIGSGGCPASSQHLIVTVKATPELSDPEIFFSICNDAVFSKTLLTVTDNTTISWNRPAIPGISQGTNSGTDEPINELLHDSIANPVTALYIVTLSHQNCENISLLFVTVNPTLTLTSDTAYTICDSIPFVYQAESAAVGTGFSWNRAAVPGISNPTASGNINLINETLTNTSNIPIVVDYVFTMTIDTCSYLQNVHVTVNPSAKVDPVANKIYCNDVLVTGIPFSSNVTGAEYFWSGTLDIGFGTNGSGSIPAFDALNAGTSPIIDTVEVYAKAYLCDGPVYSFTITINPTPVLNSDADTTLCNNVLYVYQAESLTPGTTFSWVRPHINGINPFSNSGTNNFVNETLTNTTQNPITVEYIFSLTIDTCTNLQYLQVTVNPTPEMNSASDTSICDGVLFNYLATSSTSGTHFSWSRDSIAGIGNPAGTGDDSLINESIDNITFAAVTVYYDFTLTYTNVVTCENHAILNVKVNPSPPLPSFTSLSPDAVPVTVCGGSGNINFNIDHPQGANGVTYLWTANPPDAVEIGNANNPNTVISFNNTTGQVEIKVIAFNNDSLGGCPDSVIQVVNVTTNPDSIAERKIILKQPGNVLVYPDNSMSIDSGYQWGYDLKMNDTILGPPQNIPGQVYQVFVPESKYLSGSQLDTSTYCFWVLLKRSDCQSKVYYNGPYAPPGKLIDEGTDAAIKLKTYPNPTTGSFNLLLTGNMYGSIDTKIYNTLGEVIFITSFIKNNYESNETIKDLNLPNGVYYLELESSDHQKKATRMVVAH